MAAQESTTERFAQLLAEGLQRLEGCAGEPCCEACERYAERVKRALGDWIGEGKRQ